MPSGSSRIRIQKIAGNNLLNPITHGFWIQGAGREPIIGSSLYVNPVDVASDDFFCQKPFNFWLTNNVDMVIRTSWGCLFRAKGEVFSWMEVPK